MIVTRHFDSTKILKAAQDRAALPPLPNHPTHRWRSRSALGGLLGVFAVSRRRRLRICPRSIGLSYSLL
jgi:hypothetical protein